MARRLRFALLDPTFLARPGRRIDATPEPLDQDEHVLEDGCLSSAKRIADLEPGGQAQ